MTGAERAELRQRIDLARRDKLAQQQGYAHLPASLATRTMVRWVDCPVHHVKVGLDKNGRLIGRCASCAEEAAAAQTLLEAGLVG